MKSIPKDGSVFLVRIKNWPQPTIATWSGADEQVVYVTLQLDLYHGKWNMANFENEYCDESEIESFWELN